MTIESFGEIESPLGPDEIAVGHPPSARLFAFVDRDGIHNEYGGRFAVEALGRGYLFRPKVA